MPFQVRPKQQESEVQGCQRVRELGPPGKNCDDKRRVGKQHWQLIRSASMERFSVLVKMAPSFIYYHTPSVPRTRQVSHTIKMLLEFYCKIG